MPQKDGKTSNDEPRLEYSRRDEVVDCEGHDLRDCLEMFPDQSTLVPTHVIGRNLRDVEAIGHNRVQASLEKRKLFVLLEQTDRLSPVVLDDAK